MNAIAPPEDYRSAAQRACRRADVRIEEWAFDGDRMRLTVSSEHGSKTFGATGLRGRMTTDAFEQYIYGAVLDWTR